MKFMNLKMKYSKKEIKDLIIAWLMTSLAFAILFSGGISFFSSIGVSFLITFLISGFTVGIGFLFHELMHKYMAQKYRLWAEFRANYKMLWLALLFSLGSFIIAAPGGVVSRGMLSEEKAGKISLAGPMTNIFLALVYFVLFVFIKEGVIGLAFNYGLTINSLLAVFNLIPAPGFDGRQVYIWNRTVYYISLTFAGLLFLSTFFV
jgi:Zn-dependent protease